jgi:hypothetical protein
MQRAIAAFASLVILAAGVVSAQDATAPALGGTSAAFESVLGGANDASVGAQLHFLRCAGTDIDQFVVFAPNGQVWTIQRESCALATPASQQRFLEAAQYLPADAVAGEPFTTDRGESAMTYVSLTLASALPAGVFHDCTGNAVPLGTLFVVADSYGGWFMAPGTCA